MSVYETPTADRQSTRVMDAVANRRRRAVLAVLDDRDRPATEGHLARELADDSFDEEAQVETALRHRHLPVLAEAGLVDWDRTDGRVETTDHPVFETDGFRALLDRGDKWDAALGCIADDRRRRILSLLSANGEMDRESLARAVAARESPDDETVSTRDVLISLHHADLPKLDDAGLVDYDAAAETVGPAGHPLLDAEWVAL